MTSSCAGSGGRHAAGSGRLCRDHAAAVDEDMHPAAGGPAAHGALRLAHRAADPAGVVGPSEPPVTRRRTSLAAVDRVPAVPDELDRYVMRWSRRWLPTPDVPACAAVPGTERESG